MSQLPPVGYSPQYSFWPHYFTPPETLLAPARRAGWTMVICGALLLIGGACGGAIVLQATDAAFEELLKQVREANPQAANEMTVGLMRGVYTGMGVVAALFGIALIIVGLIVRGGSMAASIIGLLLLALPAVAFLIMILGSFFSGPVAGVAALLVLAIPLALVITTAMFLFSAIRNAPKVAQARQQLAMMQHQQAMQYQAYGQQPYAQPPQWPQQNPQQGPQQGQTPPTPPPAGG